MAVDVFYVLSFGFPARTVLHTDLVPELKRRNLSVGVLCPGASEPEFQALARSLGISSWQWGGKTGRLHAKYLQARRYFFENVMANPALWARHLRAVEEAQGCERLWLRLLIHANGLLKNARRVRGLLRVFETRALRSGEVRQLLQVASPRLVVSTYPVDPLEAIVLKEAQELGIKTVVQLLSWDNISCKGRFLAVPDYFLSWGPIMTKEIIEYYGFSSDHIYETGVAHFDAHYKAVDPARRRRLLTDMGLAADSPYLFFGMSSPYFAPREIDIVTEIAARVCRGCFGPKLNLVVRPHPLNVEGSLADPSWLPLLRALESPRVGVSWPALRKSSMRWALDKVDLSNLVCLMAGCAVNLNSGSTFAIDGLAHQKPVVLTLFDGEQHLPWHRSARRCGDFLHLRKLIETGGVFVVSNYDQLWNILERVLANPLQGYEQRRQALSMECTAIDGRACERIAEALANIIQRP